MTDKPNSPESVNWGITPLLEIPSPGARPESAIAPPAKQFTFPQPGGSITLGEKCYWIGSKIGEGGFGIVHDCTDKWGNDLVAKVILPKGRTYEQVFDQWTRELDNLVKLRHPNITYVYDAFECQDTLYIIMERCVFSLVTVIEMPQLIPELWIKPAAKGILQALAFIHDRGYVHKDVHPGNVLIRELRGEMAPNSPSGVVFKLADLGISNLVTNVDMFNTIMAKWMLPPEFLNPQEFGDVTNRVDIYHTGLVLLSILLGRIPHFSEQEVLDGAPRKTAEALCTPYGDAVAKALRRHVRDRTPSALNFWQDVLVAEAAEISLPSSPLFIQP